jgi:hypothetical protein
METTTCARPGGKTDGIITTESILRRQRRLVRARFYRGLLRPFICARCRRVSLDPIGRNGKCEFLCEDCSDPGGEL